MRKSMYLSKTNVRLKPNSITLSGSKLVRSWFEPDSVMEFGFYHMNTLRLSNVTRVAHLSLKLSIFGRPFVKRFVLCYQTVVVSVCPVCLSCLYVGILRPNGWMDQDETWHAGRARPWPHCVRWGPSCPSPKGAQPSQSLAHISWPNGRI